MDDQHSSIYSTLMQSVTGKRLHVYQERRTFSHGCRQQAKFLREQTCHAKSHRLTSARQLLLKGVCRSLPSSADRSFCQGTTARGDRHCFLESVGSSSRRAVHQETLRKSSPSEAGCLNSSICPHARIPGHWVSSGLTIGDGIVVSRRSEIFSCMTA